MIINFLLFNLLIIESLGTLPTSTPINLPIEISTNLSSETVNITECSKSIENVYAASFIFDSPKETVINYETTSSLEFTVMLQSSSSKECILLEKNKDINITTTLQYRVIVISSTALVENQSIKFSLKYIPQQNDTIGTISDYPFFHMATVPSLLMSSSDSCQFETTSYNNLYGYTYQIKSNTDDILEINTCGYSEEVTGIFVTNGDKCIKTINSFQTADIQCFNGVGSRLEIEIHPDLTLNIHVGFLSTSEKERMFLLNITKIGDGEEEHEDWQLWMWFGIVTVVIMAIIVLMVVAIFIYEFIQKKRYNRFSETF
ncbi:hypothetical protein EHI8A_127800 [Entamoeba histolytica HM-1:IMSS-B]|uniref:Uncharacterized protein n=6 Tax=Entamoeba histolytica TaxID=5759 RepID=C4LWA7_ENTH1|nr:hypothetical protein EHI_155560 [Entamoeba histolytica HM-1:IMSS]EMD49314.1 Hypothetical protein EHI5A_090970 [Entamoeba histolytica KU27]EMH75674.1 hypothetical protein EHI8A_127800 [Entamoeba histolytica HM-1:IMSS-B]EMS16565.1 hypothetical protein KM1_108390 [Entamoeba histolytica HM-3:IMSS]ENY61786.1 hypothetical protein EHI7A_056500 [Entamoeba histolytica HM-1:IMSS-A]GAT92986.1 hypothetical protein CL6EHI_155560 [Entamoeba histolytica]|eukprot:XP_655786.1 hypothetical protein EHI_155560 [Entamoeba histolytica HM-1:IMSS]